MACHAQWTVCKLWKETENTKRHIIISKLVAIYTAFQEQCPSGLRLFWNMTQPRRIIVSRHFEETRCLRNVGNRLPINQRHVPHRWSPQPRPGKNFKISHVVFACDVNATVQRLCLLEKRLPLRIGQMGSVSWKNLRSCINYKCFLNPHAKESRCLYFIQISFHELPHSVEQRLSLFTITVAQPDKKFLYFLWNTKYKQTSQDW